MATKYEIKKFLERKTIDSLQKVKSDRDLKLNDALNKFIVDHSYEIGVVRKMIIQCDDAIHVLSKQLLSDKTGKINDRYSSSPIYHINELSGSFDKQGIARKFTISEQEKIETKYDITIEGINLEYTKLIAITQTMNAKNGIEYLKELGFDTAELETEKQVTALITNIDARKLFI